MSHLTKNKLQTRRDLYHLIDELISMMNKDSLLSLYFNRRFRYDMLLMKDVFKRDNRIKPKIKKRHIAGQYVWYIFGYLIPLYLLVFFFIFGHLSIAKVRSGGHLSDILFSTVDKIRDWLLIPCVLLLGIDVWRNAVSSQVQLKWLLMWYKEYAKKHPEWETNQILQKVEINWYKKIFGIWTIYVMVNKYEKIYD